MEEIYGVSFTMGIISISLILIGTLIKNTNSAELISGYDIELDSPNKEFLSKMFGNGMILMGIISTLFTVSYLLLTKGENNDGVRRNLTLPPVYLSDTF